MRLLCARNPESYFPGTGVFPVPLGRLDHVTQNALAARNNEA